MRRYKNPYVTAPALQGQPLARARQALGQLSDPAHFRAFQRLVETGSEDVGSRTWRDVKELGKLLPLPAPVLENFDRTLEQGQALNEDRYWQLAQDSALHSAGETLTSVGFRLRDLLGDEQTRDDLAVVPGVLPELDAAADALQDFLRAKQLLDDRNAQDEKNKPRSLGWGSKGGLTHDIWPPTVEQVEVLWHVTTAYREVLATGLKTSEQLRAERGDVAGLGGCNTGENRVPGVSFTAGFDIAVGIHQAILDMIEIMNGPRTPQWIIGWAEDKGLAVPPDDYLWKFIEIEHYDPNKPLKPGQAKELFDRILVELHAQGLRYNPVFFGVRAATFIGMDPENVGIIEATVDTTDPGVGYLRGMEEWRVPPRAILGFGPVGSQAVS